MVTAMVTVTSSFRRVAYVQDHVPKVAAKMNGRGAAVAAADDHQSVHFGSRGEDFALVQRLQEATSLTRSARALRPPDCEAIKTPDL